MKDIMLNELLCLKEDEIENAKMVLSIYDKNNDKSYFIDEWRKTGKVEYSYWSHFGDSVKNQRNFKVGQRVFGFVRMEEDKYLLVTVGDILEVPDKHGFCKYKNVVDYEGFIGRLVIGFHKGNTRGRYSFNLKTYINKVKVLEILPKEYKSIEFRGLNNVHLTYSELKHILRNEKNSDYRSALSTIKGVYCLTDTKEGKLYIGSAYGENGIAQRWKNYLDTKTGGNKSLIELYKSKGEDYFQNNFTFTLIEFFDMHTEKKKIIEREQYWKKAFSTRESGYNNN